MVLPGLLLALIYRFATRDTKRAMIAVCKSWRHLLLALGQGQYTYHKPLCVNSRPNSPLKITGDPSILSVVLQYISVSPSFFTSKVCLDPVHLPLALCFSGPISCTEANSFVNAISGKTGPGYVCLEQCEMETASFQTLLLQPGLWGLQFNLSRLIPSTLPSHSMQTVFLKELVIRSSVLRIPSDDVLLTSNLLLRAPFLQTFVFESCPGDDNGALVKALQRHGTLYGTLRCLVLDLGERGLDDDAFDKICETNTGLVELNISGNLSLTSIAGVTRLSSLKTLLAYVCPLLCTLPHTFPSGLLFLALDGQNCTTDDIAHSLRLCQELEVLSLNVQIIDVTKLAHPTLKALRISTRQLSGDALALFYPEDIFPCLKHLFIFIWMEDALVELALDSIASDTLDPIHVIPDKHPPSGRIFYPSLESFVH
jgi:hypothetical protein